jgi:hypothetical protein
LIEGDEVEENLGRMRASSAFKNNLSGNYHRSTNSTGSVGSAVGSSKEEEEKKEEE